jgi:predicted transcriptional regulator of viral defense system
MSFTPDWIEALAARGRSVFTLPDALVASGNSERTVSRALQRASASRVLYSPARGLWVIVPIEYQSAGAPPWRNFLDPLLKREHRPYYLGLLSAAAQHGASGQSAQEVQVVVDRPRATVIAGRQRIVFIMRRNAGKAPVREIAAPVGRIPVSTPEMTALDLVAYPGRVGGWSNVVSVLSDLGGQLTMGGMREVLRIGPATTDIQRLGYLLERLALPAPSQPLAAWLDHRATTFVPLDPRAGRTGPRDSRWRIIANITIEPD